MKKEIYWIVLWLFTKEIIFSLQKTTKPRNPFMIGFVHLSSLLFDFTHKRIKGMMIHRDDIFLNLCGYFTSKGRLLEYILACVIKYFHFHQTIAFVLPIKFYGWFYNFFVVQKFSHIINLISAWNYDSKTPS